MCVDFVLRNSQQRCNLSLRNSPVGNRLEMSRWQGDRVSAFTGHLPCWLPFAPRKWLGVHSDSSRPYDGFPRSIEEKRSPAEAGPEVASSCLSGRVSGSAGGGSVNRRVPTGHCGSACSRQPTQATPKDKLHAQCIPPRRIQRSVLPPPARCRSSVSYDTAAWGLEVTNDSPVLHRPIYRTRQLVQSVSCKSAMV